MIATGIYSGFAFLRNPIFLHQDFECGNISDVKGGSFQIYLGDSKIYEGRFFPPLDMNISEIVDAASQYFPEPENDPISALVLIEDRNQLEGRRMYASFDFDDQTAEFDCFVIPGGVSKQNRRVYDMAGTDAFCSRFLNYGANFFLTSRSAEWLINIKESELFPLYFICHRTESHTLIATEHITGASLSFPLVDDGIMALDLKCLRKQFAFQYNVLPSVFDIAINNRFACRIVIEAGELSLNRCRLKFRNSLGVFELFELTGEVVLIPEYNQEEGVTFNRYNRASDDFTLDRERIQAAIKLSVNTGVVSCDRLPLFMDMLASEEVWILDIFPDPVRVIPSIEDMTYDFSVRRPQIFDLSLKTIECDSIFMPDIKAPDDCCRKHIFSKEFDSHFN